MLTVPGFGHEISVTLKEGLIIGVGEGNIAGTKMTGISFLQNGACLLFRGRGTGLNKPGLNP